MKHTMFAEGDISTSDRISCDVEAADRLPAWSHPQQHGGFHLESFGLSLCNSGSGRAAAACCVSQTGVRGKQKQKTKKHQTHSPRVL